MPFLDGSHSECAWLDGLEIRKSVVRFYGPERLMRLLPSSFGNVSWQERQEDGTTVTKERRMTRCDMICTEVQSMRQDVDIDFSLTDAAISRRMALATKYVEDISKHGVWCSTPTIVAFSLMRVEKRPVRVYFFSGTSLYVFADTVPEGTLPPPPPHLDEFIRDFEDAMNTRDASHGVPAEDDDVHAFVPPDAANNAVESSPDEASDSESDDDSDEEFTQDITRILFNGGHYDLALTASERLLLTRVFPETAQHFKSFSECVKPSVSGGK